MEEKQFLHMLVWFLTNVNHHHLAVHFFFFMRACDNVVAVYNISKLGKKKPSQILPQLFSSTKMRYSCIQS